MINITKSASSTSMVAAKRGFFWGKKAAIQAAPLIDKAEEIKIMQYSGKIEDFNKKVHVFESYLKDE